MLYFGLKQREREKETERESAREEKANCYVHEDTHVGTRERRKSTRASNKSGAQSLPRTFRPTFSPATIPISAAATALFRRTHLAFLLPPHAPPLPLPQRLQTTSRFSFSLARARSPPLYPCPSFLSPRRGAIVLTSIFYISLQPLNALTADATFNPGYHVASRVYTSVDVRFRARERVSEHTCTSGSIREYDAT